MFKLNRKLFVFIFGWLWLTGCVQNLIPMPTEIPLTVPINIQPSMTPTPKEITLSPTADHFQLTMQANQTQNASFSLTQNAAQDSRLTEIALTPTKTPPPTLTPAPTATPNLVMIGDAYYMVYPSPTGNWIAYSHASKYPEMIVTDKTGAIQWTVNYHDPNDPVFDPYDGEIQFWQVKPAYWTADDRYLFFSGRSDLPGCGDFVFGPNLLGRLDLLTGQISEILSGGEGENWYTYAFAPGGAYLAYINQKEFPLQLTILRFRDGDKQTVDLGEQFVPVDWIIWSPDQSKIVLFSKNLDYCNFEQPVLFVVERESGEVRRVASLDTEISPGGEWLSDHEIIVNDYYGNFYLLNIITGELTPYEQ